MPGCARCVKIPLALQSCKGQVNGERDPSERRPPVDTRGFEQIPSGTTAIAVNGSHELSVIHPY